MIGTVIDKYEVLQKIGEGGMATVYRGRHVTLGRDVAIKVLHPHLSASLRNRNRFAREARAIEHLDHDNILKIFDYSGTEADDCYIVTEFVDGVTLQDILADHGRVPSEVTAMVGIELAEAMAYAHQLGIIHRDLKPENVMVRRDGTVKLMDFGIARFLDDSNLTVTGALVGSPAYMSPEQAMEKVLDPRSDLFSLGTLLYHLVTGQLPFSGNNASIILRNIIEGNRPEVIELRPDVSGRLADLIERLLETDPDDRPVAAPDVVNELHRCLDDVHIDDTSDRWALRTWLVDSHKYELRLDEHLKEVLLVEGRARLAQHDHLEALRLFNRLLSIDEDNEEVLSLVQGMHGDLHHEGSDRRRWLVSAGIVLLAAVATWTLWPESDPVAPTNTVVDVSASKAEAEPRPPAPTPVGDDEGATEASSGGASDEAPDELEKAETDEPVVAAASPPPPVREQPVHSIRVEVPQKDPDKEAAKADEEPVPARLMVLVPESWGWIYVDGVKRGTNHELRDGIDVEPGSHHLRVENPSALQSYETEFTVKPGQTLRVNAHLQKDPFVLQFASWADSCVVTFDDQAISTVGNLNNRYAVQTPDPNRTYSLTLECDDGTHRFPLRGLQPGGERTIQPL